MIVLFGYFAIMAIVAIFRPGWLRSNPVLAAIMVIIPLLLTDYGVGDTRYYETVGYFASKRLDFYFYDSNHNILPYFPGLVFLTGPLYIFSQLTHLPFFSLWRLFLGGVLLGLVFLMKKIIKGPDTAQRLFLFVLSPLTIFPALYHGHPDILIIALYILAIFISGKNFLLGGLSAGLSILIKSWSVIFLPLLFRKKMFPVLVLTVLFVSFFYIRFWHSTPVLVFGAVSSYGGGDSAFWGIPGLVSLATGKMPLLPAQWRQIYTIAVMGIGYLLAMRINKTGLDFAREKVVILVFVLFSASFSIQYVFWAWPFLVFTESLSNLKLISLASLPYILIAYFLHSRGVDQIQPAILTYTSLPLYFLLGKAFFQSLKESNRKVQRGK